MWVGRLGVVHEDIEAGVKPGELAWELEVDVVSKSASLQDSEQYRSFSACTCFSQATQY